MTKELSPQAPKSRRKEEKKRRREEEKKRRKRGVAFGHVF
jgi:hypothetical protein